jgi:hypothetical protein
MLKKLKSRIKQIPNLYKTVLKIKIFIKELNNILTHQRLEKRQFIVLRDKELVYLNNSKVACSSIKKTFIDRDIEDDYSIHSLDWDEKNSLSNINDSYFKFTFVRNPFDRLVSCYESKFHKDIEKGMDILHFDKYLLGILSNDNGFESFVKKIVKIPKFLADRHFESQYNLIFNKNGECLVDYIGKYENINEEFDVVKKRFNLTALPHYNKSKNRNWKDYYTKETAKLVYEYYKKDIIEFNYEKEYKDLIQYLN